MVSGGVAFGRYEFRLGGARYLLCRAPQTAGAGGAVLGGGAAHAVLAALLRGSDPWLVRTAYAELAGSGATHRVSDDALLRWFSGALGADGLALGFAWLALVELSARGRLDPSDAAEKAAAGLVQRLAALRSDEVFHRGNSFRFGVLGEQAWAGSGGEVVSVREAAALIQEIAADEARPAGVRALLSEAVALLTPARGTSANQRLVLFRVSRRSFAPDKVALPAAVTPSQLRKVAQPRVEVTDWIEIQFIDDSGAPMASQAYAVTLADGSTREGALDADGLAYLAGIPSGVCEISFPGFAAHVAS